MATLEQISTNNLVTLGSPTVVGRSSTCTLRLPRPEVSSAHASFQWDGESWTIRDLNSRNGTFLNGSRLQPDQRAPLTRGAKVQFGVVDDTWRVLDLHPPVASFIHTRNPEHFIPDDHGTIELPNSHPLITAFKSQDETWLLDRAGTSQVISDGEIVEANGQSWRFSLPQPILPGTLAATRGFTLDQCSMRFRVSADEEDVAIDLITDRGHEHDLGSRASYYILLLLARARLDSSDITGAEAGWIPPELMCRMTGMDLPHLNVQVFRARKYMAKAGMLDPFAVVERRPGSGKMRLGTARVLVEQR